MVRAGGGRGVGTGPEGLGARCDTAGPRFCVVLARVRPTSVATAGINRDEALHGASIVPGFSPRINCMGLQ